MFHKQGLGLPLFLLQIDGQGFLYGSEEGRH